MPAGRSTAPSTRPSTPSAAPAWWSTPSTWPAQRALQPPGHGHHQRRQPGGRGHQGARSRPPTRRTGMPASGSASSACWTRSPPAPPRTGDTLAEGMDQALWQSFGMSDRSITSKGLDPAGYEPRRLKGMALSYALSPRGACHLRATFYKPELGGMLEGPGRRRLRRDLHRLGRPDAAHGQPHHVPLLPRPSHLGLLCVGRRRS